MPKALTKRRPQRGARGMTIAESVLDDGQETSLVDLLDHVLNKGVMATGDITLGVAGVDLIYLRLSALLCAADRVLPRDPDKPRRPRPSKRSRR